MNVKKIIISVVAAICVCVLLISVVFLLVGNDKKEKPKDETGISQEKDDDASIEIEADDESEEDSKEDSKDDETPIVPTTEDGETPAVSVTGNGEDDTEQPSDTGTDKPSDEPTEDKKNSSVIELPMVPYTPH